MEAEAYTTAGEYNLEDLKKHLETECPKSRSCADCCKVFETAELYAEHLKKYCDHVDVQCPHCQIFFQRSTLPDHLCPEISDNNNGTPDDDY